MYFFKKKYLNFTRTCRVIWVFLGQLNGWSKKETWLESKYESDPPVRTSFITARETSCWVFFPKGKVLEKVDHMMLPLFSWVVDYLCWGWLVWVAEIVGPLKKGAGFAGLDLLKIGFLVSYSLEVELLLPRSSIFKGISMEEVNDCVRILIFLCHCSLVSIQTRQAPVECKPVVDMIWLLILFCNITSI
jgi:hypothetical protein